MTESSDWLGYYAGWENRGWDYGFGADGEGVLFIKKGDRMIHDTVKITPLIQQKRGDKWTFRSAESWSAPSETPAGLDPKKPVSVTLIAKEGTKAEFIQVVSGKRITIKPKFVSKETKDPIRMGVRIDFMDFNRLRQKEGKEGKLDEKELKKLLKKDAFEAVRKKDREKISFELYEMEEDKKLDGTDGFLKDGATSLSLSVHRVKKTFEIKQGNPKAGHLMLIKNGPLAHGFKVVWVVSPEEAKMDKAYVTIEVAK